MDIVCGQINVRSGPLPQIPGWGKWREGLIHPFILPFIHHRCTTCFTHSQYAEAWGLYIGYTEVRGTAFGVKTRKYWYHGTVNVSLYERSTMAPMCMASCLQLTWLFVIVLFLSLISNMLQVHLSMTGKHFSISKILLQKWLNRI